MFGANLRLSAHGNWDIAKSMSCRMANNLAVIALSGFLHGCALFSDPGVLFGDYGGVQIRIDAVAQGRTLDAAFNEALAVGQQLGLQRWTGNTFRVGIDRNDYCGEKYSQECADEFAALTALHPWENWTDASVEFGFKRDLANDQNRVPIGSLYALHCLVTIVTSSQESRISIVLSNQSRSTEHDLEALAQQWVRALHQLYGRDRVTVE